MVVPVNPVGIAPGIMKPLEPQAFYVVTYQLGVSSFLMPGQSEWPLTPAPPPLVPNWTWRQVHMLGRDIIPGKQSFDLPPKPPQRLPFYGTEWRQVGMLGQDQLPPGEQSFDLTPKAPQRLPDYTWAWRQVDKLGRDVVPGEQFYDRPSLAAPRLPLYTWEWRQVDKLGLDQLPFGGQSYDRPTLPIRGAGQTWALNLLETTLATVVVTGPLGVVANQYDWPVPRAPLRIDETWVWNQTPMLGQDVLPENQYDWPLPNRGPYRIEQTWVWRQVGMLGQDQLPVGEQVYDLTPKPPPSSPYYGTEWRQVGMLGLDRLPVGEQVTDLTSHRYIAYRLEQTTTWRQVGMLGRDQLPVGDQTWELAPKPPQRLSLYSWEWRQVGMLGQDQMLVGEQVYDLPVRAPLRAADLYTWIQSVNLALTVAPTVLPLNQYDWPLPRAPQQSSPSWTWRQVGMLGLDKLPVGVQVYNLPVRGLRLAIYDWIQSTNLALLVPPAPLPKNQYDWPLPRGPFQPDRSFTFRSPFAPPVFIGAQYFLLQPHYVNDNWLSAWTTVTEGHEVPIGWIPTLMVDPLNDQAVAAFYAAGPRPSYPGPGYDWQAFQDFNARRTAAIQSPVTHWVRDPVTSMFSLTGLGSNRPPVGG